MKLINKNPVTKHRLNKHMNIANNFSKENGFFLEIIMKNKAGNITDKKLFTVDPLKLSILIIFSEAYPTNTTIK